MSYKEAISHKRCPDPSLSYKKVLFFNIKVYLKTQLFAKSNIKRSVFNFIKV